MWSLFLLRFSFLLSMNELLNKIRVNYDLDHAGWREDCSGLFLTKSTHVNIISEIYCYVLPTFCCDKSLASSSVLISLSICTCFQDQNISCISGHL